MKRWGRLILVFIAYSFAMLHTVVPHHHAARSAGETTISHASCASGTESGGLLQRAFSTDLGYGHLENFKKSSNPEVDFSTVALAVVGLLPITLLSTPRVVTSSRVDGYLAKLRCRLLLRTSIPLRAPPLFS